MAIQIPGVERTQISSNVRRLDQGLENDTKTLNAQAQLGGIVADVASQLGQERKAATNRADLSKRWAQAQLNISAEISEAGDADFDGNVTIEGQKVKKEAHVKSVYDRWMENVNNDEEMSQTVKTDLFNQLQQVSTRDVILARGQQKESEIKGILFKDKETHDARLGLVALTGNINKLDEALAQTSIDMKAPSSPSVYGDKTLSTEKERKAELVSTFVESLERSKNYAAALNFVGSNKRMDNLDTKDRLKLMDNVSRNFKMEQQSFVSSTNNDMASIDRATKLGMDTAPAIGALLNKIGKQAPALMIPPTQMDEVYTTLTKKQVSNNFKQTLAVQGTNDPNATKAYAVDAAISKFPILKKYINDKTIEGLDLQIAEFEADLNKNNADVYSKYIPEVKEAERVATSSPQAWKTYNELLDKYNNVHSVSSSKHKYGTQVLAETSKVVQESFSNGNGETLNAVVSEMATNMGDQFPVVMRQLSKGGVYQIPEAVSGYSMIGTSDDFLSYSRSVAMKEEDLNKKIQAAGKKPNDVKVAMKDLLSDIDGFQALATVENNSSEANTEAEAKISGFIKHASVLSAAGMSQKEIKRSIASMVSRAGSVYQDNDDRSIFIPRNTGLTEQHLGMVKSLLNVENSPLAAEIIPKIAKLPGQTEEETKQAARDEWHLRPTANGTGVEVWGMYAGNPAPVKLANGKQRVTYTWNELGNLTNKYQGAIQETMKNNKAKKAEQSRLNHVNRAQKFKDMAAQVGLRPAGTL